MQTIPSDLKRAAELLQERLDLLQSHTKSVAREDWAMLQPVVRVSVPDWLIELHAAYRLYGSVLQTWEPEVCLPVSFQFCDAKTLVAIFDSGMLPLLEDGYFPVASEQDGNLWLVKLSDGPESELYWFQSTCWNGSSEGLEKALTFASEKLSYAMLSMEICDNNYHPSNGGMWRRVEREEG